jgi:hypothetical protein
MQAIDFNEVTCLQALLPSHLNRWQATARSAKAHRPRLESLRGSFLAAPMGFGYRRLQSAEILRRFSWNNLTSDLLEPIVRAGLQLPWEERKMSFGKAIAIVLALLLSGPVVLAEEANPKLTGQDPNTLLTKAALSIGTGTDRKGESPSLNLLVFTRDHKTQLASLQGGELCKGNCEMVTGESRTIPLKVISSDATYQQCQGFDSYFFVGPAEQNDWSIDLLKVDLEFANGAHLVSYIKVNRTLTPANPEDASQKIEQRQIDAQEDNNPSIVHWDQRPAF